MEVEEAPRKFIRRTMKSSSGVPVDERSLNRIWVLWPREPCGTIIVMPSPPSRDVDRRFEIRRAVFGEDIAGLVGHSPLLPESKRSWVLVDEGAAFTPQSEPNPRAAWLLGALSLRDRVDEVRGPLIVAGPGGAGLTTDQLQDLADAISSYPRELSRAQLEKFM